MKQLYAVEAYDHAIRQKQLVEVVEDHASALSQISFITKEHDNDGLYST